VYPMNEKMKSAKSVVFDIETLVLISDTMEKRKQNFSQTVNFLIKTGDYLLKKMQLLEQERRVKDEQEVKQ